MPEQKKAVDAERVCDAEHVGRHPVERVRVQLCRTVALAVTTVVERDDSVALGQDLDVIGEVFLGASEPVDEH
jgi:hypothetical protein